MIKYFRITIYFLIAFNSYAQNGKSEFADILVKSYYSNVNPAFNSFYGGDIYTFYYSKQINPEVILGDNTKFFVSLPEGSYVIVQFTDNQIIDYPNQDDIFITEYGCSGEHAEVFVSSDGIDFIKLGIVDDCKVSSLDLNTINFKTVVRFIKVVGLDNKGISPGYDLINIKGLLNSNVENYMDMSSIDKYFKNPNAYFEKKIILENVYFRTNSSELDVSSVKAVDSLYSKLLKYPSIKIKISGNTDNVGDDDNNLKLSTNRAKSVSEYLQKRGINATRIFYDGKGEMEPIKSNENEEGRKIKSKS